MAKSPVGDLGSRYLLDDAQFILEPREQASRIGNGSLQRISCRSVRAQLVRHRGQEPVGGENGSRPGVVEDEATRPVGCLGLARTEAGLANQRGLLVTQAAGDRHPAEGGAGQAAVYLG